MGKMTCFRCKEWPNNCECTFEEKERHYRDVRNRIQKAAMDKEMGARPVRKAMTKAIAEGTYKYSTADPHPGTTGSQDEKQEAQSRFGKGWQ